MKRFIPIIIVLILAVSEVIEAAERNALHFLEQSFDFGTLAEDGGVATHEFHFRNISQEPIVILRVNTSCGCTKAKYSTQPISPGEEGTITAIFNPMNYPGRFSRRLSVYASNGEVLHLTITGDVTPRVKSPQERYTIGLGGGLMAEANAHAFGYVEHGKAVYSDIYIYNASSKSLSLHLHPSQESGALRVEYPQVVAPQQQAIIKVGYALDEGCDMYGTLKEVLTVEVDGTRSQIPLVVSGIAIDCREKISNNEPPKVQLSENFIKFGALKPTLHFAEHKIKVCNTGFSPLVIRKIESEKGLVEGIVEQSLVGSDAEVEVLVRLCVEGLPAGAVTDRLRIVTNDPYSPVRTIKVTAIIER